jgi:acyl-CoA reductase-like NAD-dependent aldehyde dehydrogenase
MKTNKQNKQDDCAADWLESRKDAKAAAFQEVRRLNPAEIAQALESLADDCADRAGDLTNHGDAYSDLWQENLCRFVAEAIRRDQRIKSRRNRKGGRK